MTQYLLAIDQGTTNSRAIIFNEKAQIINQHSKPLLQFFPKEGWVEQDPEEMFNSTLECCKEALKKANLTSQQIVGIGISNQRETTIIWDRKTSKPIYPAIVWQDRRTADLCQKFSKTLSEQSLQEKTGLLLDPYFSATKILWILDNVPNARKKAEAGELAFGTVDTFLLWKLTEGLSHATDATNASRTLLFNIKTQQWDKELLSAFNIPESLLPSVLDCSADFGKTNLFGHPITIAGMAGDQQAATIGQACFKTGMVKSTFGTGCFMLLNTGENMIQSKNKLLSTIAYRFPDQISYGLEGSIFSAGVTIKWLRDTLKLIQSVEESEQLAKEINGTEGVYFVPAFTGLGAPYWNPHARAAIVGLTRNSQKAHIVRAALESVAYQSNDLLIAMQKDSHITLKTLRVDGGMTANQWFLQFLADTLNICVESPTIMESSALGAAFLAGLQSGVYQSLNDIEKTWEAKYQVKPTISDSLRNQRYQQWQQAIQKVLA